jgi:hypothetical protein
MSDYEISRFDEVASFICLSDKKNAGGDLTDANEFWHNVCITLRKQDFYFIFTTYLQVLHAIAKITMFERHSSRLPGCVALFSGLFQRERAARQAIDHGQRFHGQPGSVRGAAQV